MRYLRAFVKAVQLTASGEAIQPPQARYPRLHAWLQEGLALTAAAFVAADAAGMDQPAREALTLHLDSRDISAQVILAAVRHNLSMEYPMLMEARIEHNLTTLYAMNLNDQYRVSQLAQSDDLPEAVREAVQHLAQHLQNIPPSNEVSA